MLELRLFIFNHCEAFGMGWCFYSVPFLFHGAHNYPDYRTFRKEVMHGWVTYTESRSCPCVWHGMELWVECLVYILWLCVMHAAATTSFCGNIHMGKLRGSRTYIAIAIASQAWHHKWIISMFSCVQQINQLEQQWWWRSLLYSFRVSLKE